MMDNYIEEITKICDMGMF